jgi:1-acyl-sn-glycerol-3-phosphate acyltransferase
MGQQQERKTSVQANPASETENKKRGTKVLGVEVAPLHVPWERRMETVAVFVWIGSFIFGAPSGLIFLVYLTLYTRFWWIALLYLAWFVYDRETVNRGGRRVDWVRNWKIWKRYRNYFPVTMVKTTELDPSKNYLFCSHPHGVLCSGAFACFETEGTNFSQVYPGIKPHLLTFEAHLAFPIYREYLLSGGTCSASRQSLNYLLSYPGGGHAAVLVPGGAPESLDAHPGLENRVHLKYRKGFIKVALQNGAPLVPVFSFGEIDVYDQIPNAEGTLVRKVQNFLQKVMGMAPVILLGRGFFQYTFGILPRRKPITVVIGAPIPVEQNKNPTKEEIDTLHKIYVDSLTELFNKYKAEYASKDSYINIV